MRTTTERTATELEPSIVQPTLGRCLVQRLKAAEMRGSIFLPANHRDQTFAFRGLVVAINEREDGDAAEVKAGDRVWFSSHVGHDDSRFFTWDDKDFVLIPCEAIQAVEA